ncbi:HAD hydrolase family protein [Streptomyces mirabilis]|uniref:HAD hydrolase family protein n=1 Tax=Streptomyces mirabilis TaxID=68239 RepID=UPI0036DDB608
MSVGDGAGGHHVPRGQLLAHRLRGAIEFGGEAASVEKDADGAQRGSPRSSSPSLGVAVANASADVREAADALTACKDDDGVAAWLEGM